ncbi:MAG: hypothetical protein WAX66_02705 [Patescibacteria group bacterium]
MFNSEVFVVKKGKTIFVTGHLAERSDISNSIDVSNDFINKTREKEGMFPISNFSVLIHLRHTIDITIVAEKTIKISFKGTAQKVTDVSKLIKEAVATAVILMGTRSTVNIK